MTKELENSLFAETQAKQALQEQEIERLRSEIESLKKVSFFNSLTHKIVPIEPTDAMALAALKISLCTTSINGTEIYHAMIAAAPEYQSEVK